MESRPRTTVPDALLRNVRPEAFEPAMLDAVGECLHIARAPQVAMTEHMTTLLERMRRQDPALYQHTCLVWLVSRYLAKQLGEADEECAVLEQAALLHDVGKLTPPPGLLATSTLFTAEEWVLMREHSERGAALVQQCSADEPVVQLVLHHHERWDGRGYPDGLAGEAIPRGARLLALADAIAAMASPRPYQPARTRAAIREELLVHAGTQFDPHLISRCLPLLFEDSWSDASVLRGEE